MNKQPTITIQSLLDIYCTGNGLDVGCGYAKLNKPCIGVDLVPFGQLTNGTNKPPHLSMADISCNVLNLPFKDNTFDYVHGSHILEHITPNKTSRLTFQALCEWLRVIKHSGYLVLFTPDINHCIPPIAKRKGLKLYHGLQPTEVLTMIKKLPVSIISFNNLPNPNVFECIVQKVS